jgi:hypothetical protein
MSRKGTSSRRAFSVQKGQEPLSLIKVGFKATRSEKTGLRSGWLMSVSISALSRVQIAGGQGVQGLHSSNSARAR